MITVSRADAAFLPCRLCFDFVRAHTAIIAPRFLRLLLPEQAKVADKETAPNLALVFSACWDLSLSVTPMNPTLSSCAAVKLWR